MAATTANASTSRTVFGVWRPTPAPSATTVDLEAQIITGEQISFPSPPPRVSTTDSTDPIDDFFGVSRRGTQNSRHDSVARPAYFAEDADEAELAPPPYAEASELPSYAAVAEPPTLAMYLFKFGFLFPLFWFAGIIVLISPLNAPENWEPTKTEAERQELIELLRRTERKWAKRCLWASLILSVIAGVITAIAVSMLKY
ncbi:hypothetical protein BXZ70DRAFT_895291 [Cristinia sonorae]|uniref:Transmembrane protein n=1 Tax=Cristinia sonorae TaxID=1940300 RepID=A0A8K0ULV5_9AGAR|nr:hypothetical protein BXZ70DRAFT_895291 [Cristinia sonorae]